jgi:hypothetical protein
MPSDMIHALWFIVGFGLVFISIILLEAWYWRRRGDTTKYSLIESLSNMTSGLLYKFTDELVIALFATIGFATRIFRFCGKSLIGLSRIMGEIKLYKLSF